MAEPKDDPPGLSRTALTPKGVEASEGTPDTGSTQSVERTHAPPHGAFQPGELVLGRFLIGPLLGRGGMGEVFQAEDLELREAVALKTVRSDFASNPRVLERFRREIQLARKISHRNVCRVFDVFWHRGPTGAVMFLSMEFLPGETLSDRIGQKERLGASEAFPIVEQLAAGLGAAHAVGIVHRDLKCSNVLLVEEASGLRVAVTDFGLARLVLGQGESLTGSAEMLGTPAFMAPEQVQGKKATAASDIYSLGVVLFEMVTGQLPFVADTPIASALQRLSLPPPSPRSFVPGLDRRWERTILRCLELRPEDRPASANDVVEMLRGSSSSFAFGTRQRKRLLRGALAAGIAAVVVAGGFLATGWLRKKTPEIGAHPTVAVLAVQEGGKPEDAWVGTALAELLSRELSAGDGVRVVPGGEVARMRGELQPRLTAPVSPDVLQKVRKNLGADAVVLANYSPLGAESGGQLRVAATVQASNGQAEEPVVQTGKVDGLFSLSATLGKSLRNTLGRSKLTPNEELQGRAGMPNTSRATELYAQGLERLRRLDLLGAKDFLVSASELDPTSPLIQGALADAWSTMGYDAHAMEAAHKASELAKSAPNFPRTELLGLECRDHELSRAWEAAIAACRALARSFPDNIEYALRLAAVQNSAGVWNDALKSIAGFEKVGGNEDARLDLTAAQSLDFLSRPTDALARASAAALKSKAVGARQLEARSLLFRCIALQRLKSMEEAANTCQGAADLYYAVGDQIGLARAKTQLAHLAEVQGQTDKAEGLYRAALELAQGVGSGFDAAQAMVNLAALPANRGDAATALLLYRKALDLAQSIGNQLTVALALEGIGLSEELLGHVQPAQEALKRSIEVYRALGNRGDGARAETSLGHLNLEQGQLEDARKLLQPAQATLAELGLKGDGAYAAADLGQTLYELDELEDARKAIQASRSASESMGDAARALYARMQEARVDVAEGRLDAATAELEKLVGEFEALHDSDGAAIAAARLSLLASRRSRPNDASLWDARALKLAGHSEDPETRLTVQMAHGAAGATQRKGAGQTELAKVAREARKRGWLGLELEAEMTRALAAGNASEVRAVAKKASMASFKRLAREASAELG